jgi:predicted MFS family arabinose efflux permease
MVAARVAAGAFGGPATALSLSIVADLIPAERRGKALGAVMGAFSVASVLGVPAGLELAQRGGWRAPFVAVAAMGLLVAGAAVRLMPTMRGHMARARRASAPAGPLLRVPGAVLSLAAMGATMMATFAIVPNIAAHLQFDLGYPRELLGRLYMVGGALSFLVLRVAGRWVDRAGAPRVAWLGTVVFVFVLGVGFAFPPAGLPVMPVFALFMVATSFRNVSLNTLASKVPGPGERARFMSAQSAVQHLASAAGATLSTGVLEVAADGRLEGMTTLALGAAGLSLALPVLLAAVAARLERRDGVPPAAPHPAPATVG